jgi:glycosyltransferase involved in cell wall biosynthesis
VEIIKKYEKQLAFWSSEPDRSPADAINKGFQHATGDIMAWLNSDDLLFPESLKIVADIFTSFPEVEWIMGRPTFVDSKGDIIRKFFINQELTPRPLFVTESMFTAWTRWTKHRFYNNDFLAIQQESTFWKRSLWEKSGSRMNADALACDFDLWLRFFDHAQLYTTTAALGGFRYHSSRQLSIQERKNYVRICHELLKKKFDSMPPEELSDSRQRWKKSRFWKVFFYFNIPFLRRRYAQLLELPPLIRYYYDSKKLKPY